MNRTTTEQKKKTGSYRPGMDKIRNHFKAMDEKPTAPEWMNQSSQFYYNKVVDSLDSIGMLFFADLSMIEMLSVELATYEQATREIELNGMVLTYASGHAQQSPWVSIRNKALKNAKDIAVQFGMTINSRSRIPELIQQLGKKDEPNELDKLLSK